MNGYLTYNFDEARKFESFSEASKAAQKFVDSDAFFDDCCIEIKCHTNHWIVKLSERSYTPQYFRALPEFI